MFRNFDRLSFWLGFLAASLFWFLIIRFRHTFAQWLEKQRLQARANRSGRTQVDEVRLGNDTLHLLQSWHMAAVHFSLDEILVPPRLLAPVLPPPAYEPPHSEDITDWAIPNLPDWPELASYYGAPWLDPVEALQGGANLAIIGQPGSGKTVALAYLARQFIRKAPETGKLAQLTPVLVHAADLILPPPNPADPLSSLHPALFTNAKSIPAKRLPGFLQSLFEHGRALLLIDGLDELSPGPMETVTQYLASLLEKYHHLRAVVAAAPDQLGDLPRLGFTPVSLSSWDAAQRALLITRWGDLWNKFITPRMSVKGPATNPLLILGWLLNNTQNLTPFELTLKTWAAFAGDSLGASPQAAIEAYLRRMLLGQPPKNRQALEQLAGQVILNLQPVLDQRQAETWLGGADMTTAGDERPAGGKTEQAVRVRGALPDLLSSGLLIARIAEQATFQHLILAGYLAAQSPAVKQAGDLLVDQPTWTGKTATLNYLAMMDNWAGWMDRLLEEEDPPLQSNLILAARWLRNAPDGLQWISGVMRRLVDCLQNEALPVVLRARALSAIVTSNSPGVTALLRQLVTSDDADLRQLAVLGLGMLRDAKASQNLIQLLQDWKPAVNRAAMLALTAIGDAASLEAVASLLLTGEDDKRRSAAEALANHPEEGYPTLEDGSTMDDPAVRRAVAYGLGRARQPWANAILEQLRKSDAQWMVKDAANQMLEAAQVKPRLPHPIPALTETAWLTAFAAERGIGVAPGKPAYGLLYQALNEGNEEQRQAAIYYLLRRGDNEAVRPLYQVYFTSLGDLREMAYTALWSLAATGVQLPLPMQFGLR
jgi:HEAT repeat protein